MTRGSILISIALPIIIVGFFVIVVFASLNYENMTAEIYGIFVLVAVFVFLFGVAIGQRFSTPLKHLLDRAEQLSKGEFGPRVYLETKDEFEGLARAFNKIAEELQTSQETAQQAEAVSDVKVRAKTQELEEVICSLEQKVKNRANELQKMIKDSDENNSYSLKN